ncbi:MAG: single-stranded-DNA-specific exonuclease RecJ [Phycisphaerales bacterium]|nr:single-stranded-DNA-specific exonuclease RecJ [Phycisphaerales bacterium]
MPTQLQQPSPPSRGLTRNWDTSSALTDSPLPLVDRILAARDLTDTESSKAFLSPTLAGLHNPSLIPDLDKAAQRILDAVANDEPIVIFGDYDVDGITASAILVHMLGVLAPDAPVSTYIPHRIEEGYGLNESAIETLADPVKNVGAKVIITVDCGITAIDPATKAKELGVDLIITDHHNPPAQMDDMPDAFAVVHPRRPDSQYPFGELCGAGVAYKLAWRLATLHCKSDSVTPALRTTLVDLLVLAALGSIADIVPLVDENRVITKFGLSRIKATPIAGLRALIAASGLDTDQVDAEAVGFRLAPRLNAIGRLGHAGDALELMTSARGHRATELAEQLTTLNDERRATEQRIVKQAIEMAEQAGMTNPDRRAIVLAHEDWHPGVVGIVCSRLVDRFARPTILMQRKDGICKGSARSIEGFSIHAALESCAHHLTSFGGHDMAAGLSCDDSNYDAFVESLLHHANTHLTPEDLTHTLKVDAIARVDELTERTLTTIEQLAPFGAGNPRIKVLIPNAKLNGHPEPFGKTGTHLSLRVGDAQAGNQIVRVVGWSWWKKARDICPGSIVDLVVEPKLSHWNGRVKVEPVLSDLRIR